MKIRLRPHHAEGFDERVKDFRDRPVGRFLQDLRRHGLSFAVKSRELAVQALKEGEVEIEVIKGIDDICEHCDHKKYCETMDIQNRSLRHKAYYLFNGTRLFPNALDAVSKDRQGMKIGETRKLTIVQD